MRLRGATIVVLLAAALAGCGGDESTPTADGEAGAEVTAPPSVGPGGEPTATPSTIEPVRVDGPSAGPTAEPTPVDAVTPLPGDEPAMLFWDLLDGGIVAFEVQADECCTGQTIYGSLVATDGGDATMSLLDPSGATLVEGVTEFELPLEAVGTHVVQVEGRGTVELSVGVAVDAS